MAIYRMQAPPENAEKVFFRQPTRRLPKDIPFLVDNIWEWVRSIRYPHFPSRRHSLFAAASIEAAKAWSSTNSQVFEVLIEPTELVAQQMFHKPVRLHCDLKLIHGLVVEAVQKSGWADRIITDKSSSSPLFAPGLTGQEVEEVISSWPTIANIKQDLLDAPKFWREISLVESQHVSPSLGEVFFEPSEQGFRLRPILLL